MGDTITAWHDMQEDAIANGGSVKSKCKYIFLLDFNDGKAYRYDISALCNEKNNWNPDTESCESFLYGAGHRVNDCEWMVTEQKNVEYGN
jgi:hypothetical protein